ncbi:MAG: ATP-binding protein [Propionibacteriaceae bacterium]|jgi:hypothetical protein|nr:ATP-binding protein [Propionibacteriaceae bacterium]
MRPLPLGIQTFREIVEGGYVYADKTFGIYQLVNSSKYFFLSRPRRFGKSLLIDTIAEAFLGARELFDGFWLGQSDWDFIPHPVIRFDFTQFSVADPESLRVGVLAMLNSQAYQAGVSINQANPAAAFNDLIYLLRQQTGRPVVVLVDEYDKPIIDHLNDPERARANSDELSAIYSVLKGQDANLRFVFLTGVSKFTRTSIFSKLNNLYDISLDPYFAGICGITEADFDAIFADRLADYLAHARQVGSVSPYQTLEQARAEVFSWYGGYSWDGLTQVFNPFSLLSFFRSREFYPYWYASGVPQFLVASLLDRPLDYVNVQGKTITELTIDSRDVENATLESLLFQTGFLTVTEVNLLARPKQYTLGFPNLEVSTSLGADFLLALAQATPSVDSYYQQVSRALDEGRPEYLQQALGGLYAALPRRLHDAAHGSFYHAVFLAVMQFVGLRAIGEVSVAGGRIAGTIERPNGQTYVIEFKQVNVTAADDAAVTVALDEAADQALRQINDPGYAVPYLAVGKTVHQVAVAVTERGQVLVKTA